jgi:hypothetical protein
MTVVISAKESTSRAPNSTPSRFVVALAMLITNSLAAQPGTWTYVRDVKKFQAKVYLDLSRMSQEGNLTLVPSLTDYAETRKQGEITYRSHASISAYDCAKQEVNVGTRFLKYYAGNMGQGLVITEDAGMKSWNMWPTKQFEFAQQEINVVCSKSKPRRGVSG